MGVVPGVLWGFGTDGSGQHRSWYFSSQNGLILSYRYHFLPAESPDGSIMGGKESSQSCFSKVAVIPGVSEYSLQTTDPGCDDKNWN